MTDTIIQPSPLSITPTIPSVSVVGDALVTATPLEVTFSIPEVNILTQFNLKPLVNKFKIDKPKMTEFRVVQ